MFFSFVFNINDDIIKVCNNKDVKFFYHNLVDVALESGQCVVQSKRHHLVLEVVIAGPEGYFPFITFSDPHLMVGIG